MDAKTRAVRLVLVDMCVGMMLFAAMSLLAWHAGETLVRWDVVGEGVRSLAGR